MAWTAFLILSIAVLLGTTLLMPRRANAWPGRRGTAVAHALTGIAGLTLAMAAIPVSSGLWLAGGLMAAGLMFGAGLFVATRHRKPPDPLWLAVHVTFAGLGYIILAGLVLSGI